MEYCYKCHGSGWREHTNDFGEPYKVPCGACEFGRKRMAEERTAEEEAAAINAISAETPEEAIRLYQSRRAANV